MEEKINNKSVSVDQQIISQIYDAVEKLEGGSTLLSIIGSWKDTLSDEQVLEMLVEFNSNN